ncbi:50S ribosomal protein L3 [Wolbachia endosymbiont of Atemnus politus]|uniref:50S ribosomal protein L3 n=1 Tax=Wolbachia endosymbiont of Atemnus politus TaxID=2682840 RepID=UPI001573FE0D|nr:50S ribosomal protein L3 [Wolbachia endosymbiont of Atemnus politus]NSM56423.1 50S ribosomal protein L3 [Wolbachia endosymbiont of Atemnus politus]NSX83669.1 50S ribosomal protein L3 [Wolbachia endosymbiont of Atemnus politus]
MKRTNLLKRIGLLMKNVGHTAMYSNDGRVAVTLLYLNETYVIDVKEQDKCGYNSVILGTGDFKNTAKPQLEYLKKRGIGSRCKLYESRLSDLSEIECGKKVGVNHFVVGQYLDITGYSVGKGFAGVMKRHNFSGLRASHGVSIAHRSQGSTGQCQDPGRVFKGKKMAGHLGNSRVTVQNMKVLSIDHENSIIAVKGNNVPGFRDSYIFVRDAVKKPLHKDVPFPVGLLLDANDGNASGLVS